LKWISKEGKLYIPFIEIKGFGEKMALKCAGVKPSKIVLSRPSGQRGFFFHSTDNLVSPPNSNGNGKAEIILKEIGAYGGNPIGDISKYFSFRVSSKAKECGKLRSIAGKSGNLEGIISLDVKNGDVKGSIKEISFQPKKSLSRCDACSLRQECKAPVPSSPGIFNIAIIGEAPGPDEDKSGRGFVGRSGDVVWEELAKYSLTRADFHVANVCKCWPKTTKTPTSSQIKTCSEKWLFDELKEIDCRLILAFGNTCRKAFIDKIAGIKEANGKTEWVEKVGAWVCWCVHPSSVLHDARNKTMFEAGIKNFINKIEVLS